MNPRDLLFAISMLLVMIGMARTGVAFADSPADPTRSEVEDGLMNKGVLSQNVENAMLSHREFSRDGSVAASRVG
ncbi:hypothetical protein [Variovorax sp. Sphag1AA]|uniref:hypothetical protein n=1 Tax=Variovorax sp. Sphag1AA TaxID=2587027 RepID=UPI00161FC0FB|nr:hypothetical protein [Variovorax sp. Sphag1AA]MBB3177139.1 hypothetical protein [Variovorax sp. Sphag1AA]